MNYDKKFLKKEIERMIKELGISKSFFKRTLFAVTGNGYNYVATKQSDGGHKASLKQQYSILKDLIEKNNELKQTFTKKEEPLDITEKSNNIKNMKSFFNSSELNNKEE